jgi:hypothetical protein
MREYAGILHVAIWSSNQRKTWVVCHYDAPDKLRFGNYNPYRERLLPEAI